MKNTQIKIQEILIKWAWFPTFIPLSLILFMPTYSSPLLTEFYHNRAGSALIQLVFHLEYIVRDKDYSTDTDTDTTTVYPFPCKNS